MKTKAVHTSINEQLFWAAGSESTKEVERCLKQSDCDPLARDLHGYSALMLAARHGHEACVRVLMPHSHPLAKDNHERSASYIAMERGYPAVAGMIEAYVLAQKEAALLSTDILPAPPRRTPVIRM